MQGVAEERRWNAGLRTVRPVPFTPAPRNLRMSRHDNILQTIGNTPLVRLG